MCEPHQSPGLPFHILEPQILKGPIEFPHIFVRECDIAIYTKKYIYGFHSDSGT